MKSPPFIVNKARSKSSRIEVQYTSTPSLGWQLLEDDITCYTSIENLPNTDLPVTDPDVGDVIQKNKFIVIKFLTLAK
jgi:hypothetical protein